MLILLLTLFFIFSVSLVCADDTANSSEDGTNFLESSVDNELNEINHPPENHHPQQHNLMPDEKSVSKDFDFFGLFDFFGKEDTAELRQITVDMVELFFG